MSAQIAQMERETATSTQRTAEVTGKTYGYVHVADHETSQEPQRTALNAAGVEGANIYADIGEMCSPDSRFTQLMQILRRDDVLFIASLDKLGSTYADIIAQWQLLTKIMKVNVVVLDVPLLDTRRCFAADSAFVADLGLQFLAYAALREREHIRQRQHEGIVAAMQRGVRFGRPPKPIPTNFETVLGQWRKREISSRKAAQQLGVAQETFLRWSRKRESENA